MVFGALFTSSLLLISAVRAHAPEQYPSVHRRQNGATIGPSSLSPLVDPFYKPAKGFESKALGTVLKWRGINQRNSAVQSEYQVLYRSSSDNGTAVGAVATIFVPPGADTTKLVVTARFDNSVTANCAPSWMYSNGSVDNPNFLQEKWVVTAPDTLGPSGAMGCYRLSGRILLDSARATINFAKIGLATKPKIVLHGYSGGAGTAAWAASQAATYTPELNIVGAVFGGTPADFRALALAIDGTGLAGLAFLGAFGLANGYKAVSTRYDQILTETGKAARVKAAQGCVAQSLATFGNKKLLSTEYNTLGANMLDDSVLAPVLQKIKVGSDKSLTPKMPIFMIHGIGDQIIPINTVDPVAEQLCENGAPILYLRTQFADHFADYLNANIVPFIQHRFSGATWPKGCRKISNTFTSETIDFTTATGKF